MELRIHIPESWPAWRYCFKNPRYFLIGKYGFKEWREERIKHIGLVHELDMEKRAHSVTRTKLADALRKK